MLTKVCVRCGETKDISWFNKCNGYKDGLRSSCRPCWKSYQYAHEKATREICNARGAKRRATKLDATPSWANHDKIKAIFKEAKTLSKATGINYHVDHIDPLQSKLVCGLHVETNLQLLSSQENVSNSNKFRPYTHCFLTGTTEYINVV